jgi:tryptophanyl-tRNA synthetase
MKISPYEVKGSVDYDKVVEEFGLSVIDENVMKKMSKVPKLVKNKYFFAHRDLDLMLDGYRKGKKFSIVSGRGPSENIHLGHLPVYMLVKELQDIFGCFVFLPFSDDEKFFAKDIDYEEAGKHSIENAKDILALGFDPKKTEIFIDSLHMRPDMYNIAVVAAKKLTMSTVKAIYGFKNDQNVGLHFYPAMQAAHILYPTVKYNMPVLVPIGIDQDPHMRAARDVASRMGIRKPASIESKFLPSLTGEAKMSASETGAIYLNDSPEQVKRKVYNAFTGGRDTLKEHKEKGGIPEKCTINQYLSMFFEDEEETETRLRLCRLGKKPCGPCKAELSEKISKFLENHKKRREKVKINDYVRD